MKHGSCRETLVSARTLGGPSGWPAARTQMAQANSGENEQPAQRCPLPRAWGNDWAEAHYNGRDAALVAICERVAHCEPCSRSRYSCHPYPAEPVAVTHARAINSSLCIQNSRRKGERGAGIVFRIASALPSRSPPKSSNTPRRHNNSHGRHLNSLVAFTTLAQTMNTLTCRAIIDAS